MNNNNNVPNSPTCASLENISRLFRKGHFPTGPIATGTSANCALSDWDRRSIKINYILKYVRAWIAHWNNEKLINFIRIVLTHLK